MKSTHRLSLIIAALVFAGSPARAALLTDTANYAPNLVIPDGSSVGVADTRVFTSQITSISEIRISLEISSDVSNFAPAPVNSDTFNGDYYAYLSHASGFAVLLNRAGRTASNPLGYADTGFNVTFDDSPAGIDIHKYQLVTNPAGGLLTGTWGTDGRNVDPTTVLDTSLRTTSLASFNGLDPNGAWTLFVADLSLVGTGQIISWGLEVTGTAPAIVSAVPEPGTALAGALCIGLLAARRPRARAVEA